MGTGKGANAPAVYPLAQAWALPRRAVDAGLDSRIVWPLKGPRSAQVPLPLARGGKPFAIAPGELFSLARFAGATLYLQGDATV